MHCYSILALAPLLCCLASGFRLPLADLRSKSTAGPVRMALDPVLSKNFPRDFKNIPIGTEYGSGDDERLNREAENRRLDYLEKDLRDVLTAAVNGKQRPMFTTALIAGDCVILDALHKVYCFFIVNKLCKFVALMTS